MAFRHAERDDYNVMDPGMAVQLPSQREAGLSKQHRGMREGALRSRKRLVTAIGTAGPRYLEKGGASGRRGVPPPPTDWGPLLVTIRKKGTNLRRL